MEAPKEIYISNDHHGWYPKNDGGNKIKYIRADLAELTWDDIRQLFRIADNYESELNRPKYLSEGYCKEVLHRFLESKKEVEL